MGTQHLQWCILVCMSWKTSELTGHLVSTSLSSPLLGSSAKTAAATAVAGHDAIIITGPCIATVLHVVLSCYPSVLCKTSDLVQL